MRDSKGFCGIRSTQRHLLFLCGLKMIGKVDFRHCGR